MADQKLTQLANLAAPTRDDLLYIVDDPAGAPASYNATVQAVITGPPLFVAASDATAAEIRNADYVCDGANDEEQIQAAIDAVPVTGGKVELSSGTFICEQPAGALDDYCILIDADHPPLLIQGQGQATVIQLADAQPVNTNLIWLLADIGTPRTNPTVFRDLTMDGNEAGQVGGWTTGAILGISASQDVLVDHVWLIDPPSKCIHARRDPHRVSIINCVIDARNGNVGMRLEGPEALIHGNWFLADDSSARPALDLSVNGDYDIAPEYIEITGNIFEGGQIQCAMSGARHCSLVGNTFKDSLNASGISILLNGYSYVAGNYSVFENIIAHNLFENIRNGIKLQSLAAADGSNYRNLVHGNLIIDGSGVVLNNGIYESGANVDNNIIADNLIQGATTAVTIVGASTIVRENVGYVTENHGAAAGTADGGNIAHGCAATPTVVVATGSVASEFVSVTAIGAANFTVAIKDDAGNPGANQTVYWRAWV